MKTWIMHIRSYPYFINHTELSMDNYGTVDNPAWITTVFCALMCNGSIGLRTCAAESLLVPFDVLVPDQNQLSNRKKHADR